MPPHFLKHDKTVAPAQCAPSRSGRTRAGRRGFSGLGRVVTGGNGFLQLLDIGQLRLARGRRFSGIHMGRSLRQQLVSHLQATATAQRQFLAVLQMHRHRAFGPGHQLIAGKQPVPLDQHSTGAVTRHREDLTDNLADDTDERSHVHSLRCQRFVGTLSECGEHACGLNWIPWRIVCAVRDLDKPFAINGIGLAASTTSSTSVA
ncbi:hypothetical protein D3C76_775880 [compost metagenome]